MTGLDWPGLDWPGMLRAGLSGLRLSPAEFWDLTPAELQLLLGSTRPPASLNRQGLAELMHRFPDQPVPPSTEGG
jgi:uncharacterized phage protein (TIGR02216 family)